MAPDLNSLSPSQYNSASSVQNPSQSRNMSNPFTPQPNSTSTSRASTHSLAAAAALNATERRPSSGQNSPLLDRRASERRRSQVLMNLSLNDPSIPAPGELTSSDRRSSFGNSFATPVPTDRMGGAHHQRQPSLGDIHNELEQEQEAQVNRMLSLIRGQQQQLDALRTQQPSTSHPANTSAVEEVTPQSEQSFSFPSIHPAVGSVPRPTGRLSRESSVPTRSPGLRPLPSQEFQESWPSSPSAQARRSSSSRRNSVRDETAFYQAEQANLQRENQMLRMRIRELEKQLHERQAGLASSPTQHSSLTGPPLEAQDKS